MKRVRSLRFGVKDRIGLGLGLGFRVWMMGMGMGYVGVRVEMGLKWG